MTLARRASRLAVAAVAVAGTALAGATPSGAHNSRTAFTGVFGPYDVVGSVRYVHEASVRGVTLDLTVRTEGSRRPVEGASVRVEGHAGAGRSRWRPGSGSRCSWWPATATS